MAFGTFRSKYFTQTSNKIKISSKQTTYHVTNKNIVPSEVPNNIEDERGDGI